MQGVPWRQVAVEAEIVAEARRIEKNGERRPELVEVDLQRRARDEEAEVSRKHADDLREDALLVIDAVRLVDDQVAPRQLGARRLLLAKAV